MDHVNLFPKKINSGRMGSVPLPVDTPQSVTGYGKSFFLITLDTTREYVISYDINEDLLEDDGDDSDDSNKEHYPPFDMPKKMTNFKWVLGAKFGTKDEFKEAITNYGIYNRTCLKQFKN
ncbi:hypothetical protein MTR_4g053825 [Medicago truncatula]|uniref:Uncharacterized protein n=1 Tax=Medicago truncatula TaxID=3880 RepID=A0A072UJH9_MEDTR|nr:hypothetical protein MTR_4g053825 [Medicago truncatula]